MDGVESGGYPRDGRRKHPQQARFRGVGVDNLRPHPAHQAHEVPEGNRVFAQAYLTFHRHPVSGNAALAPKPIQLLSRGRNGMNVETSFG